MNEEGQKQEDLNDPIEEARKIIDNDKARRAQQFKVELDALMQKYNCTIEHGQILIIAK